MNFFGGGSQQQQQGPDPVFAARVEMEMYTVRKRRFCSAFCTHRPSPSDITFLICFLLCNSPQDLFNKIAASCFQKCASRKHKDSEISLGEMSCTDRCVAKYLESQQRVGAVLQKANEAQVEQQKNLEAMQKQFG